MHAVCGCYFHPPESRCVVATVSVLSSTLGPIAFLVLTLMVSTVSGVSASRVYTVPVMLATGVPLCSMS